MYADGTGSNGRTSQQRYVDKPGRSKDADRARNRNLYRRGILTAANSNVVQAPNEMASESGSLCCTLSRNIVSARSNVARLC